MFCIAKMLRDLQKVSPGAVPLRKRVAGGEIPDTSVCSAPGQFVFSD